MTVKQKLKYHIANVKFCKIKRQVAKGAFENTNCYVVDASAKFALVQEISDFAIDGYSVFPISAICEIRHNHFDRYYDKIMHLEKVTHNINKRYKIDLSNWTTIFKTMKQTGLSVIIKNENPDDETFDIGPLTKVTKTAVYLRYFNPKGMLDAVPTKINFDLISVVKFDNPYINIFSKYLRQRK